jgi:uncharacterized membrane protein (UPF0182 family)
MKYGGIIIFILIILFSAFSALLGIFGDWFWFASVGYESVFLTILVTSIWMGLLFFLGFIAFSFLNLKIAKRLSVGKSKKKKPSGTVFYVAAVVIGIFVGIIFSSWEVLMKFLNPSAFGVVDPVFGIDIGFYVFTLPFYGLILSYLAAVLIPTIILTWAAHMYYSSTPKTHTDEETEGVEISVSFSDIFSKSGMAHLSVLKGLLFMLIGAGFWLLQFSMLFSETGVVYGAGYTDLAVILPLIQVMTFISVITGLVMIAGSRSKSMKPRVIMLGIFFLVLIVGLAAAGVTQAFIVSPNEFNAESQYIEKNIQNTLNAYDLKKVDESIFTISYNLTKEDIENNPGTIGNIRLWDWRPLITTYNQLQLFRTYYDFSDVDIDRYNIDGDYKQVMVSAREIDIWDLSSKAQTWVNQRLVYTHGYGIVMNPVDKVSNGLPEFYIKDIPPESDYFEIERPEIYYGNMISEYAVVGTTTEEFDYPSGDQNIYTTYAGTGGVELSDMFRRLVYAVNYGSIELLVSGSFKPESKILMHRNVKTRADTIAPFLLYDYDPYIVVSDNGKLYWMLDAYTITSAYPYSEPIYTSGGWGFNYIRNSVKVVIDAYNGDVTYYVIDNEDPIISTYMKIFPDLFNDFSEMPADLQDHIRYPEDLFRIQAEMYSTYHMNDPRVFYNKEDTWVIPDEVYRRGKQKMIPYYIIMKLPGEEKEEFILMIPFIPRGKENLIGWMAAKSDSLNYGNLTVFQFSKQVLTYGPMQIEARIDQDTEISQKITLWSQSGSDVIRGNTLIIPIEDSILYIEPLYLEATERGTLPELKRVIVAYENKIAMENTLEEALDNIFGDISMPSGPGTGTDPDTPTISMTDREKLQKIADLYDEAQNKLIAGDLAGYQSYIDQIGELVIR